MEAAQLWEAHMGEAELQELRQLLGDPLEDGFQGADPQLPPALTYRPPPCMCMHVHAFRLETAEDCIMAGVEAVHGP